MEKDTTLPEASGRQSREGGASLGTGSGLRGSRHPFPGDDAGKDEIREEDWECGQLMAKLLWVEKSPKLPGILSADYSLYLQQNRIQQKPASLLPWLGDSGGRSAVRHPERLRV